MRFVEGAKNLNKLSIIPNPTQGKVLLSLGREVSDNEILTLKLIDNLGKIILSKKGDLLQINEFLNHNLRNLESDMYFLQIEKKPKNFMKRLLKE